MTREELIQNLGTIAHSGSKAFLNKLKESGKSSEGIIGQFGVGFYSTFMVGNSVTVYTKSSLPNSTGYCWKSDGTGTYSISEAENVDEGTTIIIHLRDDCLDFAKESKIIDLVKNMSNFVGFPVTVNGAKVNTVEPLWTLDPKKVTTEQHNEFYRFISAMWDTPTYHVLFRTDAPIDINALLYFPSSNSERFGMGQMDFGVSHYSKKVLIQKKPEKLLPTWLRFVKGIVDSADLPLNLSRELLQDSRLIGRIKSVLSNKIIRFLEERLKSDPKMYDTWFAEFGNFIREGVCTDSENSANIAKLLRFESSTRQEGELMSLQEYVNAMPDSQKEIYYISASDRKTAESSPYLEAFKDHTVLFSYEPLDEIVMTNLQKFAGKPLKSVESSDGLSSEQLPEKQDHVDEACRWFQDALGPQVTSVKPSRRLSSSPALVVDHESPAMRRILRQIDSKRTRAIKVNFEINLNHDLIKNILELRNKDEALARHLALQVFNNALISAGLVDDPRSLLPSINSLLEAITKLTEVKKN
ncbi:TNF receptor-associated protein 1 homolog, mitochondrial-like [Zophobas morio]|uniref:TNF receptor-associated protein 1 homolog, mitochondrial-like n=1 Tax=Zophobas morio TaxID=2755281 RepID=UPI00308383ED